MDAKVDRAAEATTPENAVAQKVKIDAYKWRASKLAPKRYGDKLDLTSDGQPIIPPPMSDAELAIEVMKTLALLERPGVKALAIEGEFRAIDDGSDLA